MGMRPIKLMVCCFVLTLTVKASAVEWVKVCDGPNGCKMVKVISEPVIAKAVVKKAAHVVTAPVRVAKAVVRRGCHGGVCSRAVVRRGWFPILRRRSVARSVVRH